MVAPRNAISMRPFCREQTFGSRIAAGELRTAIMPLNEEGFIARVSIRHSVSADAVRTILRALRSGGGTMAQFSHPDFGGMSQWSSGMTMVGGSVNNSLKSKLDAVCTELAAYVAQSASTDQGRSRFDPEVSY